jgi:UDP-3-O-[3-hydroxymyristoyl] glucosamine N-acyltransferase
VSPEASIGTDVSIGPFVAIGPGASIGSRTVLHPHVTIGPGAVIGEDCVIHAHASVRERVRLGNRVVLQNGVVVGADGYGFVKRRDGSYEKIPQVANVVLEDDVELGANTTVDRPAVGETRIKAGAKIDNLVQIAHGVIVGRNTMLAAQVGISGSTAIGDNVMLGGQVGVGGHLTLGDGAVAVGQSGVTNSLRPGEQVAGYPAIDRRGWRRSSVIFKHLPDLLKRLETLERRVAELSRTCPEDSSSLSGLWAMGYGLWEEHSCCPRSFWVSESRRPRKRSPGRRKRQTGSNSFLVTTSISRPSICRTTIPGTSGT